MIIFSDTSRDLNEEEAFPFDVSDFGIEPDVDEPTFQKTDKDDLWSTEKFPNKDSRFTYTLEIEALNGDPELAYTDVVTSPKALTIKQIFEKAWPKAASKYNLDMNMDNADQLFASQLENLNRRKDEGEDIPEEEVKQTLKFPRIASVSFGEDKIALVPNKEAFDELTSRGFPAGVFTDMDAESIEFNKEAEDIMNTKKYIVNEAVKTKDEILAAVRAAAEKEGIPSEDRSILKAAVECLEKAYAGRYVDPRFMQNTASALEDMSNDQSYSADERDAFMDASLDLYKKSGRSMYESQSSFPSWMIDLC